MHLNRHALRAIRERSGLSITALAARAGVSQPHLSNLESGRRQASPAVVRRLAAALAVPTVAILATPDGEAGEPSGPDGHDHRHDAIDAIDEDAPAGPIPTVDVGRAHQPPPPPPDDPSDTTCLGRAFEVGPSASRPEVILADPAPLAGLPRVGSAHVQHRSPVPAPPPRGEPPEQGASMPHPNPPVPSAPAVQIPGPDAGSTRSIGASVRSRRGAAAVVGLASAAAVLAAAVPAHANTYYSGNCQSVEHDGYTRTFQARAIASIDGGTGRYIWNWYDYKYTVDPHLSFGGSSDEVVSFNSGYISGLSDPWSSPDNHGTSGDWIQESNWKGIWSVNGGTKIKFHAAFDKPDNPDPHCDVYVGTV